MPYLVDKEHAVWSRRSGRKEKWEMRSLVERLEALEHEDLPGSFTPIIPTSIPADRPRRLVRWFSVGFACACIAAAISLLAEMIDIRATEAQPPTALGLSFRP